MLRPLVSFKCLLVLSVIMLAIPGTPPQAQTEQPLDEQVSAWRGVLEAAQAEIATDFEHRSPAEVLAELRALSAEARETRRLAESQLDSLNRMLEQLRPPADQDSPPEDETLQQLRTELEQASAQYSARARIAEVTESVSTSLIDQVAGWQRRQIRQQQVRHLPAPYQPETLRAAGADGRAFVQRLRDAFRNWWQQLNAADNTGFAVMLFILLPLIGALLAWPLRRGTLLKFGRDPADTSPGFARRIVAALADGAANAVVPVVTLGLVVFALHVHGLLEGPFAGIIYTAFIATGGYLVLSGLARATLSPRFVAWRILPVAPARARTLLGAIRTTAVVMAAAYATLSIMLLTGSGTYALESVLLFAFTVLIASTAGWVLSPRYWIAPAQATDSDTAERPATDQGASYPIPDLLRLAVVSAPLVALLGYGRLAYFAQSRLISTALLIGIALLLRVAARELIQQFYLSQPVRRYGHRLARLPQESTPNAQGMIFWTRLVTDLLLLALVAYGLLLLYGVPPTTLALWTQRLLAGVEVGGFTLAPGNLIIAALVLAAGLVLTNLLRRWLTRRILPHTRLEYGARNSIAAGAGYLGVGLSLLLALVALGLDFTNLALVIGALSLGIGFGLRNVVENFVAGVLLLIERPIKVGDWIIVGNNEGTVRHISVRSTEIETFDRASVIVPNADLISTSVINWTHKNRMARERIRIGVAYGSNTEEVARILLQCARQNEKVLRTPPPIALFVGFGDSSLDFELRCFIADTDHYMAVMSELHFAIEKALREAGISIPFPQRDVHIRHAEAQESAEPRADRPATAAKPPTRE